MSGGTDSGDSDSGIRVVVTPSQSSYFAGEPFSVTITFTNARSPESLPVRPHSHHKRGAHSISSAPLARPPTSPGTPRTAVPALLTRRNESGDKPARRGLIGKSQGSMGTDDLPQLLEQSRKRLLARSLSVEIAPHELERRIEGDSTAKSPGGVQRLTNDPSNEAITTNVSLSSARSPIPSNHPHARKQSVFDGQLQLQEMQTPVSPSPYPPSASASAFSLSLDPIAEGSPSPYPPTPGILSPALESAPNTAFTKAPSKSDTHSYPPRPSHIQPRRPSQLGLGHGPPPTTSASTSAPALSVPPRTGFSATFSHAHTELILYSYAQITGTLVLAPLPGTPATTEQAHTLGGVRARLLRRSVVGGGSMDITSSLHAPLQPPPHLPSGGRRRPAHGRSSSFSAGLLSLLSPATADSTPPPLQPWTPSQRARTPSVFSGLLSPSPTINGTVGLGIGEQDEFDSELPLPTFEVQPSMLAVDLSLSPGESRSYKYTIVLPETLPPTFKGRSLRFSYELTVGTCRAGSLSVPGSTGANSISRVMKVPIRVYNNVAVGRAPRAYDLLWPVARPKGLSTDCAKVTEDTRMVLKGPGKGSSSALPAPSGGTMEDVQEYALRLLDSFPDPGAKGVRMKLPVEAVSPMRGPTEQEDDGALSGCREAVEILTRNPKKVSYDVNKDGVKVAVLTFTKSAYRLGETVLGVVEINERESRARVLTLSAILEAQETLPSSIAPSSNSRHMRRVHAEHHSSFALSTVRTTFALDIPSDASPAFQIHIGDQDGANGGLEWKVRLCLLVAVAGDSSQAGTEGVRFKHLLRAGPRGEWGSSWRASDRIAPMERPDPRAAAPAPPQSWASYLATQFLGMTIDGAYHDGDEDLEDEEPMFDGEGDVDYGGGDEGWQDVKVETVECEVPIKVWPGNTAFKAVDVVFDV